MAGDAAPPWGVGEELPLAGDVACWPAEDAACWSVWDAACWLVWDAAWGGYRARWISASGRDEGLRLDVAGVLRWEQGDVPPFSCGCGWGWL